MRWTAVFRQRPAGARRPSETRVKMALKYLRQERAKSGRP